MMGDSFAIRLKKAMEFRNMTQAEIVEKTGITKGAISQYLKGEYEPKLLNISRIAEALDINKAWLEGKSDTIERYYELQEGGGRVPKETVLLMRSFNKLNKVGQSEAIKRVEELTYISKYIDKKPSRIYEPFSKEYVDKVAEDNKDLYSDEYLQINAAHEIKGASEEDKQHDEDIMNDDNF